MGSIEPLDDYELHVNLRQKPPCSYAPEQGEGGLTMAGSSLDLDRIQRQGGQDLAASSVKVRLYTG